MQIGPNPIEQRFRPMGKTFYQRTFEAFPETEEGAGKELTDRNLT